MPNLNEIQLTALAKEIQSLTSSLKEAAVEASNFKNNLSNEDLKPRNEGRRGNTTSDPLEITLAALGIHVPTDEEIRKRKENPDASSEIELAISLAIVSATKNINETVEKAVITAIQPGTYESGYTNPSTNEIKRPAENYETQKDATKTSNSLYPNDTERLPTAMEVAEGYNVLSTKIIPGVASVLLGPAGQAIVSALSYAGDEIKETIGEEIHKKRKAPKNTEEYLEKNKGYFEQEEKNKKEGGKDYYWNQKLQAKKDATDVKIDIDSHLNSSQGHKETGEDYKNSNFGYEAGHKRNRSIAGGAKRNTGPGPLEVFEGVTSEAQKIGGALTTIMQTLNIGADTFVGGIINGFNTALSIVQSVVAVMQAMQTINSFLKFLPIPGLATGGVVPGFGDTDSIPAMLTPGEYVVKKSVVNKFGTGFFEWINGGGLTNSLAGHYSGGGMVAAAGRQMVAVSIPDVKIKGSDLYLSWRRENNTHGRRSI